MERSLAAARAAYDQQVMLYRGGEATTTDVLEAEYERTSATSQNVNARIDLHVAHQKLLRASGRMRPVGTPADEDDRKYGPRKARKTGGGAQG
jgi:outer membrane protein TolC